MAIGIVDMSNAFSRKLTLEQGAQRAIEKIMQTTQERHRRRHPEDRSGVPGQRHSTTEGGNLQDQPDHDE